jgi:SAM-dependent methyltransferase
MAQQAAMGVLVLLPGDGDGDDDLRYRLPRAMATVLADEASPEYDVALVQMVPSLVNRAKTALPSAFATGLGLPYNDPDVAEAIDRGHRKHIHHCVLPRVLPAARLLGGASVHEALAAGARVADLGCGGGSLVKALAQAYSRSTFHGYEVSDEALACCATTLAGVPNAQAHDARKEPLGDAAEMFDVVRRAHFAALHFTARVRYICVLFQHRGSQHYASSRDLVSYLRVLWNNLCVLWRSLRSTSSTTRPFRAT